ncbi:hypothetical protein F4U02_14350 [Acinetobacter haemolyticus]|uniref:Uncharacterized protein n=2 Tax=Acinetobacter haemolyticus TaxID=29430 RepID=D4XLG1_ACIHA|nr:hypothetical protein [Acinetobacter haemolyticus]EFF83959.1 hypothetical protein HMP0015_0553 [Acinetobacter haemolyticus ATCC 19194]ENW21384.1 hypothetical protein F927_00196 [Acinetobacter haemolyticus CIP 64.3 = MTCC 9819]MQZ32161.1 hypothetical protein [Acinetobacter haemolyticus]QXZ27374.1 hypothetical protein I6L22_03505 [Acinetobacter haemolyticus]SPT48777.1 Uncharacterised protein [Acinetobacter haemolyticus]
MKKIIVIPLFLIAAFFAGKLAFNLIYNKENEKYINEIVYQDPIVQKEYGAIKKYNVYKAGKSLGRSGFYDFRIGIEGRNKAGQIYLKLYKTTDGKLDKYEITLLD